MRIHPVVHPSHAHYPTRVLLDAHPELLRRLPNRWQGNVAIATAMAATGALMAVYARPAQAADPPTPAAKVAPLFLHGEGRGTFTSPVMVPLSITEEEARLIILEELKDTGLTLSPDAQLIADTPIPRTSSLHTQIISESGDLILDLADQTKHVALEYVSREDYEGWAGDKTRRFSDGNYYDFKGTAQIVRDGLTTTAPDGAYGVFYEPMGFSADKKREDLRAQVKDFLAWLKAEGVI
jgi:hypothetical protein